MSAEGVSLSAVSYSATGSTLVGSTVGLAGPSADQSMVVTVSGFAGTGSITVALEITQDGTHWVGVSYVTFTASATLPCQNEDCPATQARAVITRVDAGITGGTITATVAGA